jgi:hypothetical protein
VIAVSHGWLQDIFLPSSFREVYEVHELEKVAKYKFYNVLWIEWIAGMAYRKGMGRVCKDAWKCQDVKTIQVTID